ncbi:hypothetical protein MPLDJ20_80122 [Mesorhizobium plurifarium]|uniref:Uncharacterized protein n=1 Tax=Mesorhizobium plurifarium TaxID=69974 RepID=A0A090FQ13_MESPL|nr:hypothetical protein MPLDJ20_80122 [Mesorhizobium plurifarium]
MLRFAPKRQKSIGRVDKPWWQALQLPPKLSITAASGETQARLTKRSNRSQDRTRAGRK